MHIKTMKRNLKPHDPQGQFIIATKGDMVMDIKTLTVLSLRVLKMALPLRNTRIEARPFHTLSLRTSGGSTIEANGQDYMINPGTVTFIPAGLGYHENMSSETSRIVVHFVTMEKVGECIEVFSGF